MCRAVRQDVSYSRYTAWVWSYASQVNSRHWVSTDMICGEKQRRSRAGEVVGATRRYFKLDAKAGALPLGGSSTESTLSFTAGEMPAADSHSNTHTM